MRSGHISPRTFIPVLAIILILSLVMTPEMVTAQWDYEENPIADTYIGDDFPNTNRGQISQIEIRWTGTAALRILLQFDLSSIPPGAIITDASLSIYAFGYSGSGARTFTAYRVSKSWIEGDGPTGGGTMGATWINTDKSIPTPWNTPGGDFVSEGASSKDLTIGYGWKWFDVTDIVATWITDGQPNYGFLIKVADETGSAVGLLIRSREATADTPLLQINWEAPPEPEPEGTGPVGGVASPTNKLEMLTPYLALAGLIATISAVYVVKRRKD